MATITIVSPRVPFPARLDGMTVRLAPILEYLARRHRIQLIISCDPRTADAAAMAETRRACSELIVFTQGPQSNLLHRKFRVLLGTVHPDRAPWEVYRHYSPALADFVDVQSRRHGSEMVFWFGGFSEAMFMYRRKPEALPCVMDWIDSPALHLSRRDKGHWLTQTRVARLAAWERRINELCRAAVYVSKIDARFAGSEACVLPNGVLGEQAPESLREVSSGDRFTLGFLGHMGYPPNIEAALRLHANIFERLRAEIPGLRLKIIGRDPTPEVLGLADEDVEVTGAVDSIWEALEGCDVMVFPMQSGAGLQNKILESLFARRSVVASPICMSPLGTDVERSAIIADTDEEFRHAIRQLVDSPRLNRSLAMRGREFVDRFKWSEILPRYEAVLLEAAADRDTTKAAA